MMSEKNRRIYYQDIVYKVCNLLDKHYSRRPGTGVICGTIDEPSSEVQDELVILLNEHIELKRERDSALRIARIVDLDERYKQMKALQSTLQDETTG